MSTGNNSFNAYKIDIETGEVEDKDSNKEVWSYGNSKVWEIYNSK